jgi:hypothetical protein
MSSLFDSLSEELFQVLKGSGKTLTLYGEDGNKTYEPKKARRVFATPDNIMVSVIEAGSDSEVKLYLSQSTDVRGISKLINTLRQITTRYNVLFNVRKYGRELQPKDFAYQASMMEASMWGTTKTSYQKFGPTKLIIRHYQPVREGVIGARGRNILSMFVETKEGERFKFAENHLSAGRAFAQHINQGGKPHDELGTQLTILAQESLALGRVNRYIHHSRNILGEEAIALRSPIKTRIVELRRAFLSMSRPRGYAAIKEAGLPSVSTNLCEATSDRLGYLQTLLQIDSNHALAESLMPVALLTMGENMTDKNSMFHGVLTLEEDAADALVEALLDEYGYDTETFARFGSHVAFNEAQIFEDAQEVLDLLEAAYQINEADAVMDYATQWTKHRFAATGNTDFQDPKDRKEFEKGIDELADGLRAILGGHFQTPEFPEHVPGFADAGAKARFYLDLYVSQHALSNVATLNYVSTIIDKMAEGKKLDGAESTIANKLIKTLEDDLNGGEMDESYYAPNPYDQDNEADIERSLEYFEDNFSAEEFLKDGGYEEFLDDTISPEDKTDPMDADYFIKGICHDIVKALENDDIYGYHGTEDFIVNTAKDLFIKDVKPVLEQNGWKISEEVQEFAEYEEKPEHHGIAAGDHVATDMGPATVISIEGDLASVEFLHGGAKTMHVDDMEKIPAFNKFGEEAELAQWFESFDPENLLSEEPYVNWAHGMPAQAKAEPTNPEFSKDLAVGDRVTHKVYGSGEVVALDDKMAKVAFDNAHVRLPDHKTVTMSKGVLTKAGAYRKPEKVSIRKTTEEEQLDELSPAKYGDYFSKAASDRARQEKKAARGDEKAALRLKKRDAGLSTAFNKMREEEMDDSDLNHVFANSDPEAEDQLSKDYPHSLRKAHFEGDEEVLGGDQGEDLIDDVKVQHGDEEVDEAFRAELEALLKNARFRM